MKTENEIREMLHKGESISLECKSAAGGVPKSLWDSYSAFANTYGGIILLGIEEKKGSFTITGVNNPQTVISDLWNTLSSEKVSSNILFNDSIYTLTIDEHTIIVIEVPRAERTERPIFLNKNLYGASFRRNGEGDYHCTREQIVSMVRDQQEQGVDGKIIENMMISELNQESIQGYRNIFKLSKPNHVWNKQSDEVFLMKIGAAGRGADCEIHPTAAGLLFFGDFISIMNEFPNFFLDYREHLIDDERWSDRVCSGDATWSGNVFDFYFRIINRLLADVKVPFQLKDGLTRINETPVHKAIREALANALIHSDYNGRRGIVIEKSFRHISIKNPGVFRLNLEDAINGGISDTRNPRIFNMFNLIDIGERSGCGLCNMYNIWEENKFPKPELSEEFNPDRTSLVLDFSISYTTAEEIRGTFSQEPNASTYGQSSRRIFHPNENVGKKWSTEKEVVKISKTAKKVLEILLENPFATAQSISEELDISSRAIEKNFQKLKQLGFIQRIGRTKGGHWEVL